MLRGMCWVQPPFPPAPVRLGDGCASASACQAPLRAHIWKRGLRQPLSLPSGRRGRGDPGGLGALRCRVASPPESLCSQRCCHCCLLGRAAQAQGQSCEYTLMVGYQCGLVFRACCVKGQETADFAPRDIGDLQEAGNFLLLFPFLVLHQPGLSKEIKPIRHVRAHIQREIYFKELAPLGLKPAGWASRPETQGGTYVAASVQMLSAGRLPSCLEEVSLSLEAFT